MTLIVGLEVHVELSTRTKAFTGAGNPAHGSHDGAAPNTLIDPVVLGLPGTLPVINRRAIDMSIMVGLALGCRVASFTKWDRKSYFYPDMPKNYQISQYDLPLCFDGSFDLEGEEGGEGRRIGIVRAHLEEDAGKLLHEWPGGGAIDYSIVDYNRAGTPLLEVVTAPDFRSAEEAVRFGQALRGICRALGVTEGVMQRGHMRFEPNINCVLRLEGGREVATPVVEIKNLNSFRSLREAIEYEAREQPRRFLEDGREMGPGMKTTRGWDESRRATFVQREKEDAHDYRYFPDPDLPPVRIDEAWREGLRASLPELPLEKERRFRESLGLPRGDAASLTEEPAVCSFFERAAEEASVLLAGAGVVAPEAARARAAKATANFVLQSGFRRAKERGVGVHEIGISASQLAGLVALREAGEVGSNAADEVFGALCESGETAREAAARLNLLRVRDDASLARWCEEAVAAQGKAAEDVRAGKMQALGRLVGEVMRLSGGKADAAAARAALLERLRPEGGPAARYE